MARPATSGARASPTSGRAWRSPGRGPGSSSGGSRRARRRRRGVPVPDDARDDLAGAGMPARIFRISFSGELAYEVYVRSWHGRALWDAHRRRQRRQPRRHAVRHRGDARPPRREGLRDRRPGDRRHGDGGRPRARLDALEAQVVHRSRCARSRAPDPARSHGSSSACCRSTADAFVPEGSALVPDGGLGTVGNVTSSYRSAALGPDLRARPARCRTVADRRDRGGEARREAGAAAGRRAGVLGPAGTSDGMAEATRPRPGRSPSARSPLGHTEPKPARSPRAGTSSRARAPVHGPVRRSAGSRGSAAEPPGLRLPLEPNSVRRAGDARSLWLAPDEWLVARRRDDLEDRPGGRRVRPAHPARDPRPRSPRPPCPRMPARSRSAVPSPRTSAPRPSSPEST